METKRTIVYVDGSNLYYGLLRGTTHKWLDVTAFAKKLLLPEYRIEAVKYFASRVIDKTNGHVRAERQAKYLYALSSKGIQVVEGYYRVRVERLEAVERPCKSCGLVTHPGYVRGTRMSEKLTDVNMATELLRDAYENRADAFVLISGDADFAPALRVVRYSTGHSV
ncbi:MAG: NYN domain-containing protein, partial [Kiritimatiellae bacterium]|nr:NYN domain-containing protein [Kiritimatiellia bacterium]